MDSQTLKEKLEKQESRIVFNLDSVEKELDHLFAHGFQKGYHCGFDSIYEHYSVKKGCTTYLYGAPYSGKTYLWFEFLINMSAFLGLKHGLFSTEMGKAHEIMMELVEMYIGMDRKKMTRQEYNEGKSFVREYFCIIDPVDAKFPVEAFLRTPETMKKLYGMDIDTLTGDPFNEFTHDMREYRYRDLYTEDQLGLIRKAAQKTGIHNCIINHVQEQGKVKYKDKESKKLFEYYPPATPRETAGGQAWFRKGQAMICVWRPPEGLPDQDGYPALKNEIWAIIQKAKPKGIGKTGIVKLYLDMEKHRYYESGSFGLNQYGHAIQDDSVASNGSRRNSSGNNGMSNGNPLGDYETIQK